MRPLIEFSDYVRYHSIGLSALSIVLVCHYICAFVNNSLENFSTCCGQGDWELGVQNSTVQSSLCIYMRHTCRHFSLCVHVTNSLRKMKGQSRYALVYATLLASFSLFNLLPEIQYRVLYGCGGTKPYSKKPYGTKPYSMQHKVTKLQATAE